MEKASSLTCYRYEDYLPSKTDSRKITERFFDTSFPEKKILSPLFLSFNCFKDIKKPDHYKVFFVTRDPRDIIVSLYYSILYSHREIGHISDMRNNLTKKSQTDGLLQVIDWTSESGIFEALESWSNAENIDPYLKIYRFEDLIGDNQFEYFKKLMQHCQIDILDTELEIVLSDLSFQSLSGRSKGSEDRNSHYRKGIAGDWKNYFDESIEAYFMQKTGALLEQTGYL